MTTTMTDQLTDAQYEIADAIYEGIADRETEDWNASQLARIAKCSTGEVYPVLNWMVRHDEISTCGRGGSWVRYRTHRHGETNHH